jgi:hypothetical protein
LRCLNSTDDLALVIRAHQCIEAALDNLVIESLPYRHDGLVRALQFVLKVDLAIGLLVLDVEERPALLAVNKIRNKFAHELIDSISKDDVDTLVRTFSKRVRAALGADDTDSDAAYRFRAGSAALFYCLESNLSRVRDGKLWDQATHELVLEKVGYRIGLRDKFSEATEQNIRARFLKLKEE